MAEANQRFDWQDALANTYQDFSQQAVDHIPALLGAVALLLAGWLVASLCRMLVEKLIRALDAFLFRTAQKRGLQQSQTRSFARVGSGLVFWGVMLFFVASSANLLGWQIFSGVSAALLTYLPNVLVGFLIILAGFALSGVARSAVISTAESTGITQVDLLARLAQLAILLTAVVIGVDQLGINVAFLTTTLIVVAGVLLGGAALAFGLGAKHFVANIIGAQTIRHHYQLGQLIKIDGMEGYLLEVTPTIVILDTEQGRAFVPAKLFHEQVSQSVENLPENGGGSSMMGNLFGKKGDQHES